MQIFSGYHPGILAENFGICVQPYGHQGVSPIAENVAPLLAGRGQNQYGISGGGGVVPLHPVAPVFEGDIIPAVLPVPVERTAGSGHFIALIFREGKVHPQIEVPGIVAAALVDINADVLTAPHEPLHTQGIAHVPGSAECQKLPLRL